MYFKWKNALFLEVFMNVMKKREIERDSRAPLSNPHKASFTDRFLMRDLRKALYSNPFVCFAGWDLNHALKTLLDFPIDFPKKFQKNLAQKTHQQSFTIFGILLLCFLVGKFDESGRKFFTILSPENSCFALQNVR